MMHAMLLDACARIAAGYTLSEDEAETLFLSIFRGETQEEDASRALGVFLLALREKGETTAEILGAARAARALAAPFPWSSGALIDVCGTGGDGLGTMNLSTASAFVVAAAGLSVAKHGNRSVTSACGSADVLEALGIPLAVDPGRSAEALHATRFAFLFAPNYHPGFRHVAAVRKSLGVRTIMNLLGPLLNPARPETQLVGVFDRSFLRPLAETLARLGVLRAKVVHGGGLDEVAPHTETAFAEAVNGALREGTLHPSDAGLAEIPLDVLRVRARPFANASEFSNRGVARDGGPEIQGAAKSNALCMEQVLAGTAVAPLLDAVALNAGVAIALARGNSVRDGVTEARELLAAGAPKQVLDAHRAFFTRVVIAQGRDANSVGAPKMPDILAKIVARKRIDVAARKQATPVLPPRSSAYPADHRFHTALASRSERHAAFILEVKKGSPSQGALRSHLAIDEIVVAYTGVADAISVLTDEPFFGGSFDVLREVRARTALPVLCKDFVVDLWQIDEAHAHGADAVLLMLSVLTDDEVREGLARAKLLGIDALVEAHSDEEVERALRLPAPIVGINNRDLRTLTVDLGTTERLAGRFGLDRIVIAESGIADRRDVARLGPLVDGFLVGSSLMREPDLHSAARALAFGRIKVCGLTRPEDVAALPALGVAYAGFVFVPNTPRFVSLEAAAAFAAVPRVPRVGVFRGGSKPAEEHAAIVAHVAAFGLAAVQLHGGEDAAYRAALREKLPGHVAIWQATELGDPAKDHAPSGTHVDRWLIDAGAGGTGVPFDHRMLSMHDARSSWMIAGGISAENAAAVASYGVYGVDASSRLESATGVKDLTKISALIDALREPSRRGVGK